MNPLSWIRFSWDLRRFPDVEIELPAHYRIAPAKKEDEKELRKVVSSTFFLDPVWNPAIAETMQTVQSWLDVAFASEQSVCLALRHGLRIIGASVLRVDPDASNHLAPGPCVLMEYRNRGFGTRLLESSLKMLRNAGVQRAVTVTKPSTPAARFLYQKFDGATEPLSSSSLLAA
jgi:ribosomal protein S18 acetylase RimI-like enzyme